MTGHTQSSTPELRRHRIHAVEHRDRRLPDGRRRVALAEMAAADRAPDRHSSILGRKDTDLAVLDHQCSPGEAPIACAA